MMQDNVIRVVHYLNQFFGGVGGENEAHVGPSAKDGPVGPGRAVQKALNNHGEVVATVICGDNYFAERIEEATEEVIRLIEFHQPGAVICGPAFQAGRYGIACGAVCKAVQDRLGIPAVTGMHKENPGVDLYKHDVYIVETKASVAKMQEVISKMVKILLKLVSGQKIGKPTEEGYFPRGYLVNETLDQTAAERAISMLLAKIKGEAFETEVPLPSYDPVEPSLGIEDLHLATVALITDGGLVPKGNPDKIESERATRFGRYSIEGLHTLQPEAYQVTHSGYTPIFIEQDPNRLVPVDVMRDLEREGKVGRLYNTFYSTSGCASILENVKGMGKEIAEELKREGVQGAILTST